MVSGSHFQTAIKPMTFNPANKIKLKVALNSSRNGVMRTTTKVAVHKAQEAMERAFSRMKFGKISANNTQVTGPSVKAKVAM